MIRTFGLVVLSLIAVLPAQADPGRAPTKNLSGELEKILTSHQQPKLRFGGRVVELPSGRVLFDVNSTQPMVPASNMKLLVMCAALDAFGKDYQYETTLAMRGNDLVVVGGGDPTLGDDRLSEKQKQPPTALFQAWAAKLKAAGITSVKGNLIVDDSLFDRQFVHPNWPPPQYQSWYEAPVGALNFASNCVEVRIKPTKAGKPGEASLLPPNAMLEIANKSVTSGKQSVSASRSRSSDTIVVTGAVAKDVTLGPVTVRDPGLYFGYVFKTILATSGIRVEGKVVRQTIRQGKDHLPADCKIIDVHRTPITWALARAGKQSLGMMAEAMIKLLGTRTSAVGSWDSGRQTVTAFLRKAGVPREQVVIDDGSGLSRNNRLSPYAATTVLQHMFNAPGNQFEALLEVLAHAGIDGTLEKRMRFPETRGRVFAKTGYIGGVRTLAGYVQTKSGKWLAFAFFYNQAAKTRPLTQLQDQACRLLAEWSGD